MLKSAFGRVAGYLGIATGILGVISVIGPVFVEAAKTVAVATSILTTVWVRLVGYKLLSPATRPAAVDERKPA